MQLWFLAALTGMVLAGVSNFGFKIAAKKGFDAQTFTFYGGFTSVILAGVGLLLFRPQDIESTTLIVISLFAGAIAAQGGTLKVVALRYIDTTIFFPLFKLLSPMLAVLFGLILFGERFTLVQWVGIGLGHIIPLLLITKAEHSRQQNLASGLIMVVLVSATSSIAAVLNKYAIEGGMSEITTLWYTSWGIFVSSFVLLGSNLQKLPMSYIWDKTTPDLVKSAVFRSTLICFSMLCVLFAYGNGGDLGIVQTIHSLYIVIPIVLSVLIYKEHINWKKVVAVVLCIVSLVLLG